MVYVFLADGFEEIEALTAVDVLRRAEVNVKTVGIEKAEAIGAHGITVKTDITVSEVLLTSELEAVVLPGGMPGAKNLYDCEAVLNAVRYAASNGKCVAAICAAPFILGRLGILNNKKAVCYPGFESELAGAHIQSTATARDGNIITGNGPAAATEFAALICTYIAGAEKAEAVLRGMLCKSN